MIAIISDVHSNLPALQAVLSRIDALGCDRIISLGDIVGYYAQPAECIDLLKIRNVVNILGNHDHYIVSGEGCPRSKLVSDITEFQRNLISDEQRTWLSLSKPFLKEGSIFFVHGGWKDTVDQYLYEVSESDFPDAATTLFAGHTHVQALLEIEGKTFCNPGSVGQPRDGDPRACFATMSSGKIDLHRIAYDIDRTAAAMRQTGFPSKCYENLYSGTQIGGRIDRIVAA